LWFWTFCVFFTESQSQKTGYPGYPDIWETKPAGYPGDIWEISGEDVSILSPISLRFPKAWTNDWDDDWDFPIGYHSSVLCVEKWCVCVCENGV